jgi:hypothetical protein
MTIKRVKQAAACRGIYFSGERKWLNNTVGYGYEFYTPNGCGFRQADTLNGSYIQIMEFPRLRKVDRL